MIIDRVGTCCKTNWKQKLDQGIMSKTSKLRINSEAKRVVVEANWHQSYSIIDLCKFLFETGPKSNSRFLAIQETVAV